MKTITADESYVNTEKVRNLLNNTHPNAPALQLDGLPIIPFSYVEVLDENLGLFVTECGPLLNVLDTPLMAKGFGKDAIIVNDVSALDGVNASFRQPVTARELGDSICGQLHVAIEESHASIKALIPKVKFTCPIVLDSRRAQWHMLIGGQTAASVPVRAAFAATDADVVDAVTELVWLDGVYRDGVADGRAELAENLRSLIGAEEESY